MTSGLFSAWVEKTDTVEQSHTEKLGTPVLAIGNVTLFFGQEIGPEDAIAKLREIVKHCDALATEIEARAEKREVSS